MKKQDLSPLFDKIYSDLERKEVFLRDQLASVRQAKIQEMKRSILSLYQNCTTPLGNVDCSKLFHPVGKGEAVMLRHRAEQLRRTWDVEEYPFTMTHFDSLNRLDAITYELAMLELDHAKELYELYWAFLIDYTLFVTDYVSSTLQIDYKPKQQRIERIATNTKRPIEKTMLNQHLKTGTQVAQWLQNALIRGMKQDAAIRKLTADAEKRDRNIDEKIIYTENTRTTGEAVKDVIGDYVKTFRTVCVDDGRACETCLAIEDEQAVNPVPIEAFFPGVTAPPFHPFCRCWYDVEWRDNE